MFALVPDSQRRRIDELDDRLDLSTGDSAAKRSAFWIMLVLSAVIAVAGVAGDSTATVIGAMIVAPLSTPILGIGLGIVRGRPALLLTSLGYVVAGMIVVVILGVALSQLLPNPTNVLSNSQVLGRTSPTLDDLLAAVATGLVGAIAVCRRDVGDVLPGVAIAISLVPPLGVVGVCLGSGAPSLALGAWILFASNVVAMVITSVIVLTIAGYGREVAAGVDDPAGRRHGRAYVLLAVALIVVAIPMVANTLTSLWSRQITTATQDWLRSGGAADAEVTDVSWTGRAVTVSVLGPAELPAVSDLQSTVDDLIPFDPPVTLVHTVGSRTPG